jgi:hypothetical protein
MKTLFFASQGLSGEMKNVLRKLHVVPSTWISWPCFEVDDLRP